MAVHTEQLLLVVASIFFTGNSAFVML